ncbi:SPOCS domain-containing protein [Aminipila terrae]|uniref:DUF3794 domain-containing protein n=1 Tax=Aminipila terrae TaxID=2697030 RepID=A0A6P1MDL2_9FIRM|nr:SPOCS domain-containing protein [Aminipila terrae]QHI72112.1 DUF3794 domain-containing protein [Aminipila terrae]
MTYDKDIPDFALQPAKESDERDEFDPSPYDRLLNFHSQEQTEARETDLQQYSVQDYVLPELPEEEPEIRTNEIQFEGTETMEPGLYQQEEEIMEVAGISIEMAEPEQQVSVPEPEALDAVSVPETLEAAPESGILEVAAEPEVIEVISRPDYEKEIEAELESQTETMEQVKPVMAAPATPVQNNEATVIVPTAGALITNELKMTDIREKPETRVYIEEDILVPDTKEDLASILSMTGKASLGDSEIRVGQLSQDSVKVTGEIELHTLYIPENYTGEHHIINIQSRLPFKTEWNVSAEPLSRLVIKPYIESIDYTVINERKFRAKLTVRLTMREYANVEMQVFQGIKGEKLQLLKEKIQMTHVPERKSDVMDINETLALKDTQPKPERILKYDVDIVENHKQITEDKAVINATIYCNVLYLGSSNEAEAMSMEESGGSRLSPQLFQGKTEFTQFIPILNPAEGSKISFNYNNLNVHIKDPDPEEPAENAFALEGTVETTIEIYKNLEREIVTDIYHRTKDVVCDKVELEAMSLGGSGVTEAAVREIINVPEKYGEVKRVIYIYGNIKNSRSFLEQNKNIVEGAIDITLLCLPEDQKKAAFRLNKEVNFRGSMEIPMGRGDTKANSEIAIKELWFDRINAKQIEVNANLFISSSVYGQDKYQVIQNVAFVEPKEEPGIKPGMVVYITKNGDTLWNIAKKYRTTMEMITEINDLAEDQQLPSGMKLLIVK